MLTRRHFLHALGLAGVASVVANQPALSADRILTIGGAGTTGGSPVALDLAAMDALPQTSFQTTTPWHKGVVTFSGVSLKDFLAAFEADGAKVELVALNDYVVEASTAELLAGDALLATRQDGQLMPISDKGPVFLIFPFDSRSELQHQSYYSRAVWQLAEINIE